jgi:hypothetical protein
MSTTAGEKADKISEAGARYDAAVRDVWAAIPQELGTRAAWAQARPGMVAAQQGLDRDLAAAKAGFDDAARTVAAQYGAGVDLGQIAAHHDDVSASLVSDARTSVGRSFAREYADTARSLVADLRADAEAARTEPPAPGTPHPDPRLAACGWQTDRSGIFVRVPPEQQLQAG